MIPMNLVPAEMGTLLPLVGTQGQVTGFGAMATEPFEFPDKVQSMFQTVISIEECREMLGPLGSLLQTDHFCAINHMDQATACNFDEGNGFVVSHEGVNYVVGVLSFITNMCRPQYPVVYTKLQMYSSWINSYL